MKKIFIIILIVSLVFSILLVGCNTPIDNNKHSAKRTDPVPVGETLVYNGNISIRGYNGEPYNFEITLTDVIRGDEAKNLLQDEYISRHPEDEEEFIIAKFKIRYISSKKDDELSIYGYFDFVSNDWAKYSNTNTVQNIKPAFKSIYPGGETEGYIWNIVSKNDTPLIVLLENTNGGLWFKTAE
ncbi:MAG: hypothetical protein FWH26_03810 [Oscillospiraceae bacterium]|nr:hypothetical protein [Oscillospiraceae bacterium]